MPHNCTADGARARDDEELGKVDERRQSAAEEDHHPFVDGCRPNGREFVGPGDQHHEHDASDGGLVEEELEAVHFVFALVGRNPNGVDGADEDARERKEYAEHARLFGFRVVCRLRFVIGDDEDAQTHGQQGVSGVAGDGFLVEEVVDEGHHGGEEDPRDLVKGDGGVGQGEVLEDDVEAHCGCERKHRTQAHRGWDEEGNAWEGEDVEG